jgi:hypothetical protein
MKDMKRAYRRHKKWVKFTKRVKTWTQGMYSWDTERRDEWVKEIYDGQTCNFLKTTARPCNCWMCTFEKYERPKKQDIQKTIWDEIIDSLDNR